MVKKWVLIIIKLESAIVVNVTKGGGIKRMLASSLAVYWGKISIFSAKTKSKVYATRLKL